MTPSVADRARLMLVAALAATSIHCATTPRSDDRELQTRRTEVSQRTSKTEQITELFSSGVDELDTDLDKIREHNAVATDPDIPHDLLRFVAVSCLNGARSSQPEPRKETDSQTTNQAQNAPLDLRCRHEKLDVLVERLLAETPEDTRSRAFELLKTIDDFQHQRDRLQRRLQQVSQVVENNRSLLAERRAELRNRRQQLTERRAEFSSSEWNQLESELESYSKALDNLKEATDQLDARRQAWPTRIETLNRSAYLSIVDPFRRSSS